MSLAIPNPIYVLASISTATIRKVKSPPGFQSRLNPREKALHCELGRLYEEVGEDGFQSADVP